MSRNAQYLAPEPLSFGVRRRLPMLLLLAGCSPADPPPLLEPAQGPSTGYFEVAIDLDAAGWTGGAVTAVALGGVPAFGLHAGNDGRLLVTVQGVPDPDLTRLRLSDGADDLLVDDAFTWAAPDPAFARVASFGASLTQGVMNATPTYEGVPLGPSLAVARQLGAYLPQPLLVPGLFPTLGLDSVGPAPDCQPADVVRFLTDAIGDVLGALRDDTVDPPTFRYALGRVSPDLTPRNVAAGNFRVGHVLRSPTAVSLVENFLGHLSIDPEAPFGSDLARSQIELLESFEPTLVFSTDLFGNDALTALVGGEIPGVDQMTPAPQVDADLEELLGRLAATGAQVFIADLPDPTMLPLAARFDAQDLVPVIERVDAYNGALRAHAARWDNVHVVPLATRAAEIAERGLDVDDQHITVDMLGGLLSLDGVHFSDIGYAMTANAFLEAINAALGTDVALVDLDAVAAASALSPRALAAAGRDPEACR
jgi:lysophospholipase L1-like esterase